MNMNWMHLTQLIKNAKICNSVKSNTTGSLEEVEMWYPGCSLRNTSWWRMDVWHGFSRSPPSPLTPPDTHVPSWASRHRGRVTHRWLWGAPSCRCGRCRTVAPASGPYTRTSPGPRSAPDRSGGRPSHAERLYLQTERWEQKKTEKKVKLAAQPCRSSQRSIFTTGGLSDSLQPFLLLRHKSSNGVF